MFVLFCAVFGLFVAVLFPKIGSFLLQVGRFWIWVYGGREGRQAERFSVLVVVEITEFSWEREYVNKWDIDDEENEKDIKECVLLEYLTC